MTVEADAELEETRVCFRWGKEQLSLVKKGSESHWCAVSDIFKMAVYQHSLDVLKDIKNTDTKSVA